MASGCLMIIREYFTGAHPFSGRICVEVIRGGCEQSSQQLACFYFS